MLKISKFSKGSSAIFHLEMKWLGILFLLFTKERNPEWKEHWKLSFHTTPKLSFNYFWLPSLLWSNGAAFSPLSFPERSMSVPHPTLLQRELGLGGFPSNKMMTLSCICRHPLAYKGNHTSKECLQGFLITVILNVAKALRTAWK